MIKKFLRPILYRTIYRVGSVRPILKGPARGLRYRIFPDFGLSPIMGGWEYDAQKLMVEHLPRDSVAYDVGANYGIHTLLMARLVKKQGHVYAFEPMPKIRHQLQGNIRLNGFSNVTCVNMAVDDRCGTSKFMTAHHAGAGHLADVGDASGEMITVETTTLDNFVFEGAHRPPKLIKIDIEGAEGRALSGGKRVLEEHRPILLMDLHNPEQDIAVGAILLQFGYRVYRTENSDEVKDLSRGWPEPQGLWGQIIALPGR